MSATILVLYDNVEGARFDLDYYMMKHMPLVAETFRPFGLKQWRVVQSAGTMDDARAPFRIAAFLEFEAVDQFRAAVKAEGATVFDDVPNFTDIEPTLVLGELVGRS